MNKRILTIILMLCILLSNFSCLYVNAAIKPPTPSVSINSPSNSTITLGQSFSISGSGTNCHHICGFVNGAAQATQNGNSYSASYTPSSTGTYSVYIAGRNTANSSDSGSKLATSASRTVTVVAPTGTITIYSTVGATVSGQLNGTINSSGYCSWSNMPYVSYTFSISKSGYIAATNNNVTLNSSSTSKTVNLIAIQPHTVKITVVNSANGINQTYTADGSKYSIQIFSDTLPTSISLSATDNGSSTNVSPSSISLSSTASDSSFSVNTSNGLLTLAVTIIKRASQGSSTKWHTENMHVYQVTDTTSGITSNVNFTLNVDSGANVVLDGATLKSMVPNVVSGHKYQIYYSRVIAITVNGVDQSPLRDCHVQNDVKYLNSVFPNEKSFFNYDSLYSFWIAPIISPSIKITSPTNGTIITLGQSVTISGTGTNCHHICDFINGSADILQNGNSYSTLYTPTVLGTYSVFLRGRNTPNDTDPGTLTADSSTVTFKVVAPATSITVNVKDKTTGAAIPGASISGGGSGSTDATGQIKFTGLSYGTYTFNAAKTGFSNNSGSTSTSVLSPSASITIYLDKIPTTGSITVTVKDNSSNAVLSGVSVNYSGGSGSTNSSGVATFTNITFGTYSFTASKVGYYSNTGSTAISLSTQTTSITIYLNKIPTTGDITVNVKDNSSNAVLSGVSVSYSGGSGTTNTSGTASFYNIPFGIYTFTASKSGYYSNTGNATISLSSQTTSITIYLTKIPTINLSCNIETFGDVRTNTDVIFNVIAYNTGDTDIVPSNNVKVSFTAAGITQTVQLVVPQNSSQIIPFRVHTPNTAGTMTLTAIVDSTNAIIETKEADDSATQIVNVDKPIIPIIADSKSNDVKPSGWRIPSIPANIMDKRTTWTEWRYNTTTQSFSKVQFYVDTSSRFTINPDPKIATNKYAFGEYITKSGYGVEAYMKVAVTTNYDRSGIITPAQRVWVYTPESNYSLFKDLELTLSGFTMNAKLRPNKYSTYNARLHFTPVWFPDGYFTMYGKAMDIWTPAGEVNTGYSGRVTISGSVYDDWHIGPLY